MTLPALLFGFLIASLYGALYHLVRNGRPSRLLLFLLVSWAGFTAGHLLAAWREWLFLRVGPLNLGMATLGSLLLLVTGDVASQVDSGRSGPFPGDGNGV